MSGPARSVQRLRLRGDSEASVRRALPCLEDAFRTASLPDAGARLIVVRRFHLGRLPAGASAQTLSLLIESRVAAADWTIVHAGETNADRAHAVWFRDRLEAHELAARRAAGDRSLQAWFWRLAIPALAGAASPAETLRALAFSLAALEEAPSALPAWVSSLARAGYRERLIAALRPGDGTALLRAARASEAIGTAPLDGGADGSLALPDLARGHALRGVLPADHAARPWWSLPDDRERFVERLSGHPARRGGQATPATAPDGAADDPTLATVDRRAAARSSSARRAGARGSVQTPPPSTASVKTWAPAGLNGSTPPVVPSPAGPEGRAVRPPPRGERSSAPSNAPDSQPSRTWRAVTFENAAEPTAAGGLLFVVPVLERLGLGAWCAQNPHDTWREPGVLARRIFDELLGRLQVPGDDAAWRLAARERDGDVPPTSDRDRESILGRIEGRMTAASGDRRRPRAWLSHVPRSATAAGLWIAACRFMLRRHAHLGLASLVRRPARLAFTDTHVDVYFDLTAADIRIRRAALDIDPGWVPWFGAVVTFHYEDRSWR